MSRSILFLTQVLPYPLDSGPKVRAYHVLRALAVRADVHLASFVRDDDPPEAIEHLATICRSVETYPMRRSAGVDAGHVVRSMLGGKSFIIARDEVSGMQDLVGGMVARTRFDAVHADQLWMAQYARELDVPFKVLDQHNAVYRIFERLGRNEESAVRRWFLRREAGRLLRYEIDQLDWFDRVLFVSEEDRSAIMAGLPKERAEESLSRTSVIPICLDVGRIRVVEPVPVPRRVTVLGTMYWPPNAEGAMWLATQVWPRVAESVPDAVLTVIGKRPPRELQALADVRGTSMEVTGYVPETSRYLRETAVFAVPLLSGGGMRVKILDAWSWGLPVVSTHLGAEGLTCQDGRDLMLASQPAEFAGAVVRLLGDEDLRRGLAEGGRRAVEERYDAAKVYGKLDDVYAPVWDESDGDSGRRD